MPPIISTDEIQQFSTAKSILIREGVTAQRHIWSTRDCDEFVKYYNQYESFRDKNNYLEAWENLSAAIQIFREIDDAVLIYDYPLVQVVNRVAQELKESNKYISNNIEIVLTGKPSREKIVSRTLIRDESQLLRSVIRQCDSISIEHNKQSFREKFYGFTKEHPYLVIAGGVLVGIGIGATIICCGPAALIKLGITTAEAIKAGGTALTATKVIGVVATVGTIAGTGIIVANAEAWSDGVKMKRILGKKTELLRRQIADLEEMLAEQGRLDAKDDMSDRMANFAK